MTHEHVYEWTSPVSGSVTETDECVKCGEDKFTEHCQDCGGQAGDPCACCVCASSRR